MFKIPTTYFIKRMATSKSILEWLENYNGYINQMTTRNRYFMDECKQSWIKFIKA